MDENQSSELKHSQSLQKTSLKEHFTTVTPISKLLAMVLFVALPFVGFWIGINYQGNEPLNEIGANNPVPTQETSSNLLTEDLVEVTDIPSSTLVSHQDPTQDEYKEKLRNEIRQTRDAGCIASLSDGIENIVCTDKEAEETFYLERCLTNDSADGGMKPTILGERYLIYPKSIPNYLKKEEGSYSDNWELVKDCVWHEGKYWDGIYNKNNKEIFYIRETLDSSLYGQVLTGVYGGLSTTYPLFLVAKYGLGRSGEWKDIIDPNKLTNTNFGNIAKVNKLYERNDFEYIGTILFLEKGIVSATDKGVAQYNYTNDTFNLVIPTERYWLFTGMNGGHGPSYIDSLEYVSTNTFSYQLFDENDVPQGERVLYELK